MSYYIGRRHTTEKAVFFKLKCPSL